MVLNCLKYLDSPERIGLNPEGCGFWSFCGTIIAVTLVAPFCPCFAPAGLPNPAARLRIWRSAASKCGVGNPSAVVVLGRRFSQIKTDYLYFICVQSQRSPASLFSVESYLWTLDKSLNTPRNGGFSRSLSSLPTRCRPPKGSIPELSKVRVSDNANFFSQTRGQMHLA